MSSVRNGVLRRLRFDLLDVNWAVLFRHLKGSGIMNSAARGVSFQGHTIQEIVFELADLVVERAYREVLNPLPGRLWRGDP
jgi:hypothetical protein